MVPVERGIGPASIHGLPRLTNLPVGRVLLGDLDPDADRSQETLFLAWCWISGGIVADPFPACEWLGKCVTE